MAASDAILSISDAQPNFRGAETPGRIAEEGSAEKDNPEPQSTQRQAEMENNPKFGGLG